MSRRRTIEEFDHHRGAAPLLQNTARWRTVMFVAINLLGFSVVGAFAQYLLTGRWFHVGAFFRNLFVPMGTMFLSPMAIYTHPWMIPVYGLLLAVMVFVPIIVAILYRLRVAMIFVLVLAAVAQLPLLAVAVLCGCLLAGYTPLRSNLPMVAALLGLLLVWSYVFLLGSMSVDGTTDWDYWAAVQPMRRWVLYSPYVIAMVVTVVASSVVLALARWARFLPGVIWPVLLVVSALPITTFYVNVGPAELEYSLIVRPLSSGDRLFADRSLSEWLLDRPLSAQQDPIALTEDVSADLMRRRDALFERCEAFLETWPDNLHACEVLYIMGQAKSLQLDRQALAQGVIRGNCAFVLPASREYWRGLIRSWPDEPQAALARWKLAELDLREQRVLSAHALLLAAEKQLGQIPYHDDPMVLETRTFAEAQSFPPRAVYSYAAQRVAWLRWIMRENQLLADVAGTEALARWLAVDLTQAEAAETLAELFFDYRMTNLADNLHLAQVMQEPSDYQRVHGLLQLVDTEQITDAVIEAQFELGQVHTISAQALKAFDSPRPYLERVSSTPDTPWQSRAQQQMKWLEDRQALSRWLSEYRLSESTDE